MVNRILLLEDNLVEARILQEYIKDIRNLTVSLEHSQSIADFKSKVEKNDFDLFIVDLNLNESFGVKTYLAIKDFINNKPVIILSNLDESLVADSLMHHGAYVFVSKNELDISNFEQIIKNALARYGKVVQKNPPFVQAPIQMLKNEVATNFSNSDLEESLSRNINVYRQTMAKFHDMPLNILDPEVFRDFVQLYSKAFDQLMSLTAIDVNKIKHVLSVNFDAQIDAILMLKLSPNDFYLIHQDCIRTKILKEEDELKAKTILFYFLNYLFNAYQMA